MKTAIIAAMEREVSLLVRSWSARNLAHDGRNYKAFERDDAILICSGIGMLAARRAAEAVIREVHPTLLVSVGFAGALHSKIKVGDFIEPQIVINAADGSRTVMRSGQGTLVSYSEVADREQKARLEKAYGADAVDMEAAAVAQAAEGHGIEFAALKAISDSADFVMPPTEKFISSAGEFHAGAFALHVALRPWLWGSTMALSRNSARASEALCAAIEEYLEREPEGTSGQTQGRSTSRRVHV